MAKRTTTRSVFITGKTSLANGSLNKTLDLGIPAKGIYMVRLHAGEMVRSGRLFWNENNRNL